MSQVGGRLGKETQARTVERQGGEALVKDPAVKHHHHRQLLTGCLDRAEQPLALLGVHRIEAKGDAVAAEQVPQLVRAGRPLLADDPDRPEPWTVQPPPLVEELTETVTLWGRQGRAERHS